MANQLLIKNTCRRWVISLQKKLQDYKVLLQSIQELSYYSAGKGKISVFRGENSILQEH